MTGPFPHPASLPHRRIIVCAGPGGVGKTTVAASLAARAARAGRRTLVATVDPAPRLADALGLGALGADPVPVPDSVAAGLGLPPGGLSAARIDPAKTFRRLVETEVADRDMRRRIFDNTIYREITTTLTGSQEYAATLALYDFWKSGEYDLLVVDTPPTANALEFLDAPRRLSEAISSPVINWFARTNDQGGRFSLSRLRSGGALVIQRLGKLAGSQFLDDLGAFLTDFRLVLGTFLERAQAIEALLQKPDVGFVLVSAPETASVNEALYFLERLREGGLSLDAFVANRVWPTPDATSTAALEAALGRHPALATWPGPRKSAAIDALTHTAQHLAKMAGAQKAELARLTERAPDIPILEVPLLGHDPSTIEGLRFIGERLLGPLPAPLEKRILEGSV